MDQIHYCDVTMGTMASQITSSTTVYSTVYRHADERKHQSSASLAFVRGIHRGPVKMLPFDNVIMVCRNRRQQRCRSADITVAGVLCVSVIDIGYHMFFDHANLWLLTGR